jgi:hypothetical protein
MRLTRFQYLAGISLLMLPLAFTGRLRAADECVNGDVEVEYRWDLVHLVFGSTHFEIFEGGKASALANDGSKISMTGHGTFQPNDPDDVTGGGRWTTFATDGTETGTGRFRVTQLVRFTVAPGFAATNAIDLIPGVSHDLRTHRSGLLIVKISYSDGTKGVLVVSCHLPGGPGPTPPGAPASIFEGITASKGYTDYWNRLPPVPNVDGNRTLFHILDEDRDKDRDKEE